MDRTRRGRTGWGIVATLAVVAAAGPAAGQDPAGAGGAPADPAAKAASLYDAGAWGPARAAYRRLVAAAPGDGLAWLRLARTEIELGAPGAALEALERAAASEMSTPFIDVYRARALVLLDRYGEAIDAIERVQDSPALGGRAGLGAVPDLARLAEDPRWERVLDAAERAAYPCADDPVHREFDFWVGEWAVFTGGRRAGTNRIERRLGGCALAETWTNVQGREGRSFNWVDRSSFTQPRWRQLWIDDMGNTLDYTDGAVRDGAMRFSGHTLDARGDTVLQKLTFVPVHADTVRQVFEQSTDGGVSWRTTWEGLYVRIGGDRDGAGR